MRLALLFVAAVAGLSGCEDSLDDDAGTGGQGAGDVTTTATTGDGTTTTTGAVGGGGTGGAADGGGGGEGGSPPMECDPDAHPLPNVGLVEAPGTGGCPAGMLRVDDFCVDQYEASLVSYPDGDPVSPYWNPDDTMVMAVSVAAAVPQGYINQIQAEDACLAAGKRLCTDTEWLRACQGPSDTTYPYGDDLELGVCNDHRDQHPAIEYFMTTDDWIWSELGHPCLNQLADGLDHTGDNAGCVTAEGAFDMMGNLHEWTADPNGTFRGGFYVDTMLNGPGCLYATTAHDVSHWDYSTGFRCCADP
ncbi:MAG: SUMF1/EgtB/PvdO family nonheme iron enzyme [Polyangiaceae bacterium]|nr:SUMF1/EgtB/PvdO family nonheme iron enzyme [Polyangiaceae bacterium]